MGVLSKWLLTGSDVDCSSWILMDGSYSIQDDIRFMCDRSWAPNRAPRRKKLGVEASVRR